MNILIVEDEKQARESLKQLIQLVSPKTTLAFETGRVEEAIRLLKDNTVDLVFLDIELEDGIGFDVLEALPNPSFHVIFTTAFDNNAVEAFRYNAMDYLLKPINPYELQQAIQRVEKQRELEQQIKNVDKKILIKTTDSFIRVFPSDIIRLKADGSYTYFITKNNRFIVSKNLRYYHNLLGNQFLRVHQSHLVHQDFIVSLNGSTLVLSNGDKIPVASRRKQEVLKALQ